MIGDYMPFIPALRFVLGAADFNNGGFADNVIAGVALIAEYPQNRRSIPNAVGSGYIVGVIPVHSLVLTGRRYAALCKLLCYGGGSFTLYG
mgnify:CR=1 FL=1